MTSFDLLTESLCDKGQSLPRKAKSLVFALSAYRLFPIYEYFHKIHHTGDPALLKQTLDDIFDHAVNDLPVLEALFKKWGNIADLLYPDEDIGMLAPIAGDVTLVVASAGGMLFLGERSFWDSGSMECCLVPFRYTIGLERLEVTNPGDSDALQFYEIVMNDERFVRECRNLEDDLESLLAVRDSGFADLAVELRERALINKLDAETFCLPLMEWEKKNNATDLKKGN